MRVHSRLALFVAHVRGCTLSVCVLVAASHSLCAEWLEPRQVLSGKALFVTHSLNTWPSGVLSPFFWSVSDILLLHGHQIDQEATSSDWKPIEIPAF